MIIRFDEIEKKIRYLKKIKKRIVLCHGVFDLLHYGHIKHLEEAKKQGDILIVSITHDKYIDKNPNNLLIFCTFLRQMACFLHLYHKDWFIFFIISYCICCLN